MCQFGPTIHAGRPGHTILLFLLVGLYYAWFGFCFQSPVSWVTGLDAYGQMIKEVPSQMPILLWLVKLSFVFPASLGCLIVVTFFAICTKNGRLIRLMATLQFAVVATQLACGVATVAFYAELLRPQLESNEVVIEAAAQHPASFYTVKKYERESDKMYSPHYVYKKIFVSDTNWFIQFRCGPGSVPAGVDRESKSFESPNRTVFESQDIKNCTVEGTWGSTVRLLGDVFSIPFGLSVGYLIAFLTQQQVSFYVQPSERVGCERLKVFSPEDLKILCLCFAVSFKESSSDDEDDGVDYNEPNRAEEGGRYYFEYERAQMSRV